MSNGELTPTDIERTARDAEERTRTQAVLDVDRRTGNTPLEICRIGDTKMVWAATGVVSDTGNATVYLTSTGDANGEALFSHSPFTEIFEDALATGGGIARASGPAGQDSKFHLKDASDYSKEIIWDTTNRVFSVKVTNNTGSSTNFVIKAWGI